MKKLLLVALLLLPISSIYAAKVDTLATYSTVMQKQIKAVVITPDSYDKTVALPTVYLLHGYGDYYGGGWFKHKTGVERLADTHQLIIVCPDGNNSWYFDSPIDKSSQYETYIIKELIPFIDQNFKTVAKREGRGITGLSMGGHGALYLALRHQDVFGAAGSMSGGVDIRSFSNSWGIIKWLGPYAEFPDRWEKNTVAGMLYLLTPKSLALVIDCGTDDFFYDVNVRLHEKLLERNIPHDFISRPGKHDWDYWKNAVKYQMLFMHEYFEKALTETTEKK